MKTGTVWSCILDWSTEQETTDWEIQLALGHNCFTQFELIYY